MKDLPRMMHNFVFKIEDVQRMTGFTGVNESAVCT